MADEIKYWSLTERLLDQAIRADYEIRKAKRKIRGWFSASNAGYCPRAAILNRRMAKENPPSPKFLRILWTGSRLHDAIIAVLSKTTNLVAFEEFVGDREYDYIIGSIDYILRDDDGRLGLHELKSINSNAFWYKIVKAQKAKKHNIYQAVTYWILQKKYNLSYIEIEYFSKENCDFKTFRYEVTPQLLYEVKRWWEETKQNYDDKILPDVITPGTDEYKEFCNWCSFRPHYCFNDDLIQIKKNIKELGYSGKGQKEPPKEEKKKKGSKLKGKTIKKEKKKE